MLHFSLMPALMTLQTSKVQIFASSLPLSSIVYSLSLRYSVMTCSRTSVTFDGRNFSSSFGAMMYVFSQTCT